MNKKCLRIIFLYIISKFILLNLIYITSMPQKAPPFVLNKKLIIHIDLKDILILHSDKSAKD
jgi:L-asparagine transporter-like permease